MKEAEDWLLLPAKLIAVLLVPTAFWDASLGCIFWLDRGSVFVRPFLGEQTAAVCEQLYLQFYPLTLLDRLLGLLLIGCGILALLAADHLFRGERPGIRQCLLVFFFGALLPGLRLVFSWFLAGTGMTQIETLIIWALCFLPFLLSSVYLNAVKSLFR
ncbi:MAG: hypothetical protein IKE21_06260 [Erysipelotrichaceae bacterium]|nr:hypothetical protein [Erysipelotrichaceae bacterium]